MDKAKEGSSNESSPAGASGEQCTSSAEQSSGSVMQDTGSAMRGTGSEMRDASGVPETWEVEQKFALASMPRFVEDLTRLGFEKVDVEVHCDTYFRHPCRDFRATDEAFRLRRVNDRAVVTYKGPRLATVVKVRPETELGIEASEFEDWQKMLCSLGFEPLPSVRKTRAIFKAASGESLLLFSDGVVTADEVEDLGAFAELECMVYGEESLQDSQRKIEQLSTRLQLSRAESRSYLSQLLEKLGTD